MNNSLEFVHVSSLDEVEKLLFTLLTDHTVRGEAPDGSLQPLFSHAQ